MWKSFGQLVVQGHVVGEWQMKSLVRNMSRGRNKLESCCLLTCPAWSTHTGLRCAHFHQDPGAVGRWWGQMWRPSRKGRIFLQSCEPCQAFGLSFATGLQILYFLYGDKLTQAAVKALEYVCFSYFLYTICPFSLNMRGSHFQFRMHEWEQGQKDKRIVQSLISLLFITLVIYQETDCFSCFFVVVFVFLQHICKCYLLIVTTSSGLSTLILYHKLWPAAFCCCCFLY